jgi:HSP20 family protein
MTLQIWRPGHHGIVRRHPWSEFGDIERWFEDWMDRSFTPRTSFREIEWAPFMEMFDEEDKYVVKAELPGMKDEDVDISVSDNILTIKGEKKSSKEAKEKDYHFSERAYGSFCRSITLPSSINFDKISASFEDGVLEINLPKSPEVKPKKIAISTKKVIEGKKEAK